MRQSTLDPVQLDLNICGTPELQFELAALALDLNPLFLDNLALIRNLGPDAVFRAHPLTVCAQPVSIMFLIEQGGLLSEPGADCIREIQSVTPARDARSRPVARASAARMSRSMRSGMKLSTRIWPSTTVARTSLPRAA